MGRQTSRWSLHEPANAANTLKMPSRTRKIAKDKGKLPTTAVMGTVHTSISEVRRGQQCAADQSVVTRLWVVSWASVLPAGQSVKAGQNWLQVVGR